MFLISISVQSLLLVVLDQTPVKVGAHAEQFPFRVLPDLGAFAMNLRRVFKGLNESVLDFFNRFDIDDTTLIRPGGIDRVLVQELCVLSQ
ncbi:hypothetical protein D3C76_1603230 [compost metagenome]